MAERIRAAHDPLVVSVEYRDPNPFEGAPGSVWITLAHDASRDQVNAFYCDVVVPTGGAAMFRARHLMLWQADQQPYEPGIFEPVPMCPPVADPRPWVDPTPVVTMPPPGAGGSCSDTYENPIADCDAEWAAVRLAVADLGPTPSYIDIRAGGFPCGEPFETKEPAETCFGKPGLVAAYVEFEATDKVAALTLTKDAKGYVATVAAFQVPPESFKRFLWPYGLSSPSPARSSGG